MRHAAAAPALGLAIAMTFGVVSAAVAEETTSCRASATLLEVSHATLQALDAADEDAALQGARAMIELIPLTSRAVEAASWPADYVNSVEELAKRSKAIIEHEGDGDNADVSGFSKFYEKLSRIHKAQCAG